ncbi:MAG: hypothetical protein KME04_02115 [Pleurocapsa minor GSE-CHR-MK-17-07R]|nr:hypothetical protein [Pleurocapsa minor GSE-CHR-MK 17-07R]MBW4435899.1 hypothetical protein [Pleurocapsa minor GSE-CHR-MK 17-07R]
MVDNDACPSGEWDASNLNPQWAAACSHCNPGFRPLDLIGTQAASIPPFPTLGIPVFGATSTPAPVTSTPTFTPTSTPSGACPYPAAWMGSLSRGGWFGQRAVNPADSIGDAYESGSNTFLDTDSASNQNTQYLTIWNNNLPAYSGLSVYATIVSTRNIGNLHRYYLTGPYSWRFATGGFGPTIPVSLGGNLYRLDYPPDADGGFFQASYMVGSWTINDAAMIEVTSITMCMASPASPTSTPAPTATATITPTTSWGSIGAGGGLFVADCTTPQYVSNAPAVDAEIRSTGATQCYTVVPLIDIPEVDLIGFAGLEVPPIWVCLQGYIWRVSLLGVDLSLGFPALVGVIAYIVRLLRGL